MLLAAEEGARISLWRSISSRIANYVPVIETFLVLGTSQEKSPDWLSALSWCSRRSHLARGAAPLWLSHWRDAGWSPRAVTQRAGTMFPGMLGTLPTSLPIQQLLPHSGKSLWVYLAFLVCSGGNRALPWLSGGGASSCPGAARSGCIATSRLCTGGTAQPWSASSRAINYPESFAAR